MVDFKQTMGGYEVWICNGKLGYISKEDGFFTSSADIDKGIFFHLQPTHLREIADKIVEVRSRGW